MTTAWEHVQAGLASLLRRFSTEPAAIDSVELARVAEEWSGRHLKAVRQERQPLGGRRRSALLRDLGRLGGALAAWAAPLEALLQQAGASRDVPGPLLFEPGPKLLAATCGVAAEGAAIAAELLAPSGPEALEICRAVRAMLGTGCPLAAHAVAAAQHPTTPPHKRQALAISLASQLVVVKRHLVLAERAGVLGAFAEQLAPPAALLPWLSGILASLEALPLPHYKLLLGLPTGMDVISFFLCSSRHFWQHRSQLVEDAGLSCKLSGVLLHSLHAAAIALQLPPDRRPGQLQVWLFTMTHTLASLAQSAALDHYVSAADDASLLRLLRCTAVLVQHSTAEGDGAHPGDVLQLCSSSVQLLVLAARSAEARGLRQQAAGVLLPLMPQLAAQLRLAAGATVSALSESLIHSLWKLCLAWESVLATLCQCATPDPADSAGASSGLPAVQWCAAAVEAVKALPQRADLASQASQLEAAFDIAEDASELGFFVAGLAHRAATMCGDAQCLGAPAEARLAAATWQLHEACCRWAHWTAGRPEARLLLPRFDRPALLLLSVLNCAFTAARQARFSVCDQPGARTLECLCAAHWRAMQAALALPGCKTWLLSSPEEAASATACVLAICSEGPLPGARSPELLHLLGTLLRSQLPVEGTDLSRWTGVLRQALAAPRLAAQLLSSGALAGLLDCFPAGSASGGSWQEAGEAACSALRALWQAADVEAAAGGRASGGASGGAQIALQAATNTMAAALSPLAADKPLPASLDELRRDLPPATELAVALQAHWQGQDAAPELQQAAQLELAQAAATRTSCAHLACPNLEATSRRGKLCSGCRVARYCCHACSVADWRAGHCAACRLLAAARAAEVPAGQLQGQS